MKIGRVFPDLLTPLGTASSIEAGLARTLRRLVALTGARGGALVFRPPRAVPVVVTAATGTARRRVDASLRDAVRTPVRGPRRTRVASTPGQRGATVLLRVPLGEPARPVGELALLGAAAALAGGALPGSFARELGAAIAQVWRLHERAVHMQVLNEVTALGGSRHTLDEVLSTFAAGAARLVRFDALAVALLDAERGDFEVVDVAPGREGGVARRDRRLPLGETLMEQVAARGQSLRVDDLRHPDVPARARATLGAAGYAAAVLVPLASRDGVFGAVTVAARERGAFLDADVEILEELARPLASAIEQRRLLDESRRRAEELAALYGTSRLITARLDLASVLDRISRSVSPLIGSTGCGIGLLDESRTTLVHAAAHGFRTEEWRALAIPVGEGIIGGCAASGTAIRVDDIAVDPRSARRDVDEREGIRSLLCVPLQRAGTTIGVISAISTAPSAFTAHHQRVLEAFAEQAAIAIHNARLFEESVRRTRETRALLQAGQAVTASLDVAETVRVILEEARAVLGVASCGIMTVDAATGDLVSVASLDLPADTVTQIRVRVGEGLSGLAVKERRPVQSRDLLADERVRYAQLPRASGFRSMLAAPLRVGARAIGAISVYRTDVHDFSPAEEELLMALADQAAIALDHARLYTEQERVVAERTRELDEQRRFVEVVLETMPLGVFVVDPALAVARANPEGARVLGYDPAAPAGLGGLLSGEARATFERFLREAFTAEAPAVLEAEAVVLGEVKALRFTATPLAGPSTYLVLLVDDITRAKRLEAEMLQTERLTMAGRMAAGVAHELNNPLATIAGCAESLLGRTREQPLAAMPAMDDFRHYLGLVEEEAYRCKELTSNLLRFVRDPGSQRAATDLNELVRKAIVLLQHQSRFATRRIVTELEPDLAPVTANEGQLRQVVLGIASNALEAMEPDGVLTVRTRRRRDGAEMEFVDQGVGIPAELLPRIFDPFVTTKPPGQGTGLGLAIAQGIVAEHGGRIEVTSEPGKGSVFRVVLPA